MVEAGAVGDLEMDRLAGLDRQFADLLASLVDLQGRCLVELDDPARPGRRARGG